MRDHDILVSGASIAGPALAYWLRRHGFNPTVVEKAPRLRPGGQAVDIRGAALGVVERMGLLADIRRMDAAMRGMSFVDSAGEVLHSTTEETLTGGEVGSEDVEILRDDLAGILYEATRDGVEYLFGDSITSLAQDDDGVRVTFERGAPRTFGLVVGADGLHSNVRALAFGEESRFIRHLDTYLSVFTTDNFLDLDHWQVFHRTPGKMSGLYSARNNTEARAVLGFESPRLDYDHRDITRHKQIVAERFADDGWETARLLKAMWEAPDFHFDSMSQIRMDSWSNGRVSLVGDAGYCGSPLSGQGTTLALVGAYVLAGELLAAGGDHRVGLARYEEEMREFAGLNQDFALRVSEWQKDQSRPMPDIRELSNAITLKDYRS
ncbi:MULTISPECIES: FAD-dependent monooxygenase [Streptosporangium]|uniref:2-polyprenyl-6-methoxyphenol hydroxylase-like FAD-dependent oxidoreductase n=1 Tax=Streptosporangium brasiliense TaxID=47480 RepID=A0ABT9R1J2_9ACTN|nr:FAD-dependent monooxygenase [Streptosporangium brasiliense]MDP9863103.1 2-polyprenyl-6-methoxyphenol hydroxylase-like FAD-dependent oxidoreductase [Streptosporangium brasiliense]